MNPPAPQRAGRNRNRNFPYNVNSLIVYGDDLAGNSSTTNTGFSFNPFKRTPDEASFRFQFRFRFRFLPDSTENASDKYPPYFQRQ